MSPRIDPSKVAENFEKETENSKFGIQSSKEMEKEAKMSIFPSQTQIALGLATCLLQKELSISEEDSLIIDRSERERSEEGEVIPPSSPSSSKHLLQMLFSSTPFIQRSPSPYLDALIQLYSSNPHLAMSLLASSSSSIPVSVSTESIPLINTPVTAVFSPPLEKQIIPSPDRRSSESSRGSASTPMDASSDVIVPSTEKEGWCRNKKYIEKVDSGYMCTVCKKVYGRYNSVSYHVTIYHRNPPIRCEQPGCNFTTREARYIHFHKYYRHHIPLPDNIDLGSRKCPFCRHVSKSPAMLEKHISRHVPGDRTSRSSPASTHASPPAIPSPSSLAVTTSMGGGLIPLGSGMTPLSVPSLLPQLSSFPHGVQLFQFPVSSATNAFLPAIQTIACNQCDFRTNSVLSLSQHLSISHASLTFTRCTLCDFESTDANLLLNHISEKHQ